MSEHYINIPDLGGIDHVTVLEVLVKKGQKVDKDQPLLTLESDKATMDVMADQEGVVQSVLVKIGQEVSEGTPVVMTEVMNDSHSKTDKDNSISNTPIIPITLPDLGGVDQVAVLEVFVKPGDHVEKEQPLLTLESDKATMDVPSPYSGVIMDVKVQVQQSVSVGQEIATIQSESEVEVESQEPEHKSDPVVENTIDVNFEVDSSVDVNAGPLVRRLAFELDIQLNQVKGTGVRGRITKEDIIQYIQSKSGGGLPSLPKVDPNAYGEVDIVDLSRIQALSGPHLHACWVNIPHVTQHIDVDITDLEEARNKIKGRLKNQGIRVTPVTFIIKAIANTLKQFPRFCSSLDDSGKKLILKKYVHVGVAVDTENGLMVPVIKDVDQKSVLNLATELVEMGQKARDGEVKPTDLRGGCITVSSLGGIGGRYFTPIINAPEVAIIGLSKTFNHLVLNDGEVQSRTLLPVSISYDHRVIDGAEGARFAVALSNEIEKMTEDDVFKQIENEER